MSRETRPRVLVVEDEPIIADTLAVILWRHGYYAVAAYTGESGLQQARTLKPDVVISDVLMPGMNGTEMAIQIRQFLPSCAVLLFSGQAATADLLEEARRKGPTFEIIAKPLYP